MMHQNQFSPPGHNNLDPNLMSQMNMGQPMQGQSSQMPQRMRSSLSGMAGSPPLQGGMLQPGMGGYQPQPGMWQGGYDQPMHDAQGHSPSDTWSNTSGQAVPTTVNVEDW